MPLPLPDLDDRSYDDLMAEARALILTYAPEWTNHNPSDPGITLVELFAYLTDLLLYRVNRVSADSLRAFLQLLNGPTSSSAEQTLTEQIRSVVLELRYPNRAVTCADFEFLARAAASSIQRVQCLPRRNLESGAVNAATVDQPGHISVIIIPGSTSPNSLPGAPLLETVRNDLNLRRLITTQVHVVGPRYFAFGVQLTIMLKPDVALYEFLFTVNVTADDQSEADNQSEIVSGLNSGQIVTNLGEAFKGAGIDLSENTTVVSPAYNSWVITDNQTFKAYSIRSEQNQANQLNQLNVYENSARNQIVTTLQEFWDPLTGGTEGTGWPFGHSVYVSEIYQFLDQQPGIDYVTKTLGTNQQPLDELTVGGTDTGRLQRNNGGEVVAIQLYPNELIDTQNTTFNLVIQVPSS